MNTSSVLGLLLAIDALKPHLKKINNLIVSGFNWRKALLLTPEEGIGKSRQGLILSCGRGNCAKDMSGQTL